MSESLNNLAARARSSLDQRHAAMCTLIENVQKSAPEIDAAFHTLLLQDDNVILATLADPNTPYRDQLMNLLIRTSILGRSHILMSLGDRKAGIVP